jgi:hypothetical protein
MKKVSKEFIDMCNGVLNGEKWQRKIWDKVICIKFTTGGIAFPHMRKYELLSDDRFGDLCLDSYSPSKECMQATDWIKVND